VAKPELGTKRLCGSCAAKFYDLDRNPILCPKCGTQFELAVTKPAPEPAKPAKPEVVAEEAADTPVVAGAEIISLEEADAETSTDEDIPDLGDDEVDAEIGEADDDTFLDTEDEDDSGVSDIVGAPKSKEVE
jgi:uncharacterized protein (TIGR02300 family)